MNERKATQVKVEGCHQLICISAINVLSKGGKTIALKMNIQVSKGKCGILIMKETGEMVVHMRDFTICQFR